ncbi:MAG TPA: hypothetical protein VFR15_02500 [Chloroflexia bacterium]|nr:hypothetical protein [Chloroflexia bacterium]
MRAERAAPFDSEHERRVLTGWFGVSAALAWVVVESISELLFGPHVRLVRSLALGSAVGAAAGLLASGLQWFALRGRVRGAGRLVPATMAGSTAAGLLGGLAMYTLLNNVALYRVAVPLQGAAGAVFVGLVTALGQWAVLRSWAVPGRGWRDWARPAATGAVLGAASACAAAALVMGAFGGLLDRAAWPYIWIGAYLAGGIAGGTVFGRFVTLGLRRVLSGAADDARGRAEATAPKRAYPST